MAPNAHGHAFHKRNAHDEFEMQDGPLRHLTKKAPKKHPHDDLEMQAGPLRHLKKKQPEMVMDASPLRHVKLKVPEEDNKMRFIHNSPAQGLELQNKQQVDVDAETIYSQAFVTASKDIAGDAVLSTPAANAAEASYLSAKSAAQGPNTQAASSSPTSVLEPVVQTRTPVTDPTQRTRESAPASSVVPAPFAGTPIQTTHGAGMVGGTPLSATHSSDAMIGKDSDGMTAGAKAGLALGVIALIGLAVGLILFCLRRRKQQMKQESAEKLDEKHASRDSFFGGMAAAAARGPGRESVQSEKSFASSRTAATAPRLSLRPVTQFLPNIMENRKSSANALDTPAMSEKPKSGWTDRRPANATSNPFDDAAVLDEKSAQSNPFEEGAGAVAAAPSGKNSPNHSQKNSWEGSEPATPKSAKFGTAAAVPINGAQTARGPNNVHRVQLDFKPSMEDELELISGQIVRMLHEYDDGWALCIRLDRSQQGVCPRTCLSKLPVKPRPQGPPSNSPPGRPMGPPPQGMRRPESPAMNGNMVPRPLTPTGRERSRTLGRELPAAESAGRPRSQSMSGANERQRSPTAVPSRKPVPGVAL
ncbi:hypothetical protein LTR37_005408 [Vermiconidia calcicola]|uniref:Uncharacterized protein n=1 Tax=Vermiconidia calcicola TaxID=1690605 RepID=A0ACC3NJG8_9PEZI|nr:hypothetical protein LTR37_005408 [Vermiconidia calcicola]